MDGTKKRRSARNQHKPAPKRPAVDLCSSSFKSDRSLYQGFEAQVRSYEPGQCNSHFLRAGKAQQCSAQSDGNEYESGPINLYVSLEDKELFVKLYVSNRILILFLASSRGAY